MHVWEEGEKIMNTCRTPSKRSAASLASLASLAFFFLAFTSWARVFSNLAFSPFRALPPAFIAAASCFLTLASSSWSSPAAAVRVSFLITSSRRASRTEILAWTSCTYIYIHMHVHVFVVIRSVSNSNLGPMKVNSCAEQ